MERREIKKKRLIWRKIQFAEGRWWAKRWFLLRHLPIRWSKHPTCSDRWMRNNGSSKNQRFRLSIHTRNRRRRRSNSSNGGRRRRKYGKGQWEWETWISHSLAVAGRIKTHGCCHESYVFLVSGSVYQKPSISMAWVQIPWEQDLQNLSGLSNHQWDMSMKSRPFNFNKSYLLIMWLHLINLMVM